MIHPGAIVSNGAKISKNVKIGPFSFIGKNVKLVKDVRYIVTLLLMVM